MDVDGVLTDGKVWFVPSGEELVEVKSFHVADGAGIALAHRAGLKTGVVSARAAPGVRRRAEELSVQFVHLDVRDKKSALEAILRDSGVPAERVCFVGDEVVDLPAMSRVGFPVAVQNAVSEVRSRAAYVTASAGGNGAVREVIELILKAQGKWDAVVAEFLE
jgi:3-deoxy-D-manno-octulosonate 8-phosphate phosphatase (KDO 8-P phosphatase)